MLRHALLMVSLAPLSALAQQTAKEKQLVEPLSYGNAVSVIGSLLVVLGILFAAAWLLRRGQGLFRQPQGSIEVVSQLSLGVKEKVLLLRVGEENVLVGCAPGNVRPLHVWQGKLPEQPAPDENHQQGFVDHLRRQLQRGGQS